MKLAVAVKAVIEHDGKLLLIRAAHRPGFVSVTEGKYEVPGGRIEPGEHLVDALKREVKEETGLDVEVGQPFAHSEWRPTIHGEETQIVALFFRCTASTNSVVLSDEHTDYIWIKPEEYAKHAVTPTVAHVFADYIKVFAAASNS